MNNVVDLGTERRIAAADEARDASKWTARDVLVDALRRLDSGELSPNTLAIVYLVEKEGDVLPGYTIASLSDGTPPFYRGLALAHMFLDMVMKDATS